MQAITKKIDDSYIVWFEQSNRWVQFAEPAWYVYKLYQKGLDNYTISLTCAKKYRLDKDDCLHFVTTICKSINDSCTVAPIYPEDSSTIGFTGNFSFIPYSVRYYFLGDKRIVIKYSSRLAEYYLHPPFAHLEIERFEGNADEKFEILEQGNEQLLRINENSQAIWVYNDFNRLKKRIFLILANSIYNKTNHDWLSYVHASAITDGKQTLLISSSSGSGKSTMAALLQTKGLQLVSDDFVPIDAKFKRAFPFPAAQSIKQGAFSFLSTYYENLQDSNFNSNEFASQSIRYIAPQASGLFVPKARPVKHIIFIQYNPAISCKFKRVPIGDALKLYHEQAWVSSDPKHARAFINWFVKLQCYRLEYGDSKKGIDKILGIFKTQSKNS